MFYTISIKHYNKIIENTKFKKKKKKSYKKIIYIFKWL